MQKYKVGEMVRYVGPRLITYKYGHLYEIIAYNAEEDSYAVWSDGCECSSWMGESVLEKAEIKNNG